MNDDGQNMVDMEEINIDSSILSNHNEALDNVFRMYIEDINPLIVQYETVKGDFPIEIQNEIRAIYGHLIRACMTDQSSMAAQNIERMRSHSKRALMDCFKYNSIVFSDNYDDFMQRYEGVDLTYIEEGQFLPRIVKMCNTARKKYQKAKILETSNLPENEKFLLYEDVYRDFKQLNDELDNAEKQASFLQHKATKRDKMAKVSFIVGVLGVVVGIAGCLIGLVV